MWLSSFTRHAGTRRRMTPATTVVLALAAAAIGQSSDTPSTAAERLCKGYETISSITCSIRKTTSGPEGRITLLSRVFYEKPDRVHIENVAPQKRRIIADGSKLYYHEDGRKKGYAESIPRLSDTFRNALRNQPATPLEHLRKLRSLTEDELDGNDRFATRKGYQADKLYIVLSLDREGRLGRITVAPTPIIEHRPAFRARLLPHVL